MNGAPGNHPEENAENLTSFEQAGLAIVHSKFKDLSPAQKIAQIVSVVLSPSTICPLAFIWFLVSYNAVNFWAWAAGGIYFYGLHPVILPAILVATKKGDIYVTDRRQRFWPFISAIAGYCVFLGLVGAGFGWTNLLTRVILGSTILSFVILFVSLRWKISIHATGNGVAIAGLGVLDPRTLWVTLPIQAFVLWARRELKAHTLLQLAAGTILGFGVPLCVIYLIP
ncbi:MAG TPA: hypothetical protein VKK79_18765 [Candidatus Lokiarchaeia archaeon]|nr:hypothetical protein [Candidatus Lokiarchaeia archaeon]